MQFKSKFGSRSFRWRLLHTPYRTFKDFGSSLSFGWQTQTNSKKIKLPQSCFVVPDSFIEHFQLQVGLCPPQQGLHVLLVQGQGRAAVINGLLKLFQLEQIGNWKLRQSYLDKKLFVCYRFQYFKDILNFINQIFNCLVFSHFMNRLQQ